MNSLLQQLQLTINRWQVLWRQQPGLVVAGYMSAAVSAEREGPNLRTVFVPGADVVLEDQGSGAASSAQTTDLSGRFTFHNVKPGNLRLCWKADGFTPGCRAFTVTSDNVHLSETVMSPERGDRTTIVFGDVRLADGAKPRLLEPLIGLNAYATVELVDQLGATVGKAVVNNFGQYVLPQVPVRIPIILRARIEAGIGELQVAPEAQLELAPAHRIDLVVDNRAPKLEPIAATDGKARRLKVAKPGSTVQVVAQAADPDGDPITYHWLAAAGSGTLSGTGPQVSWTLPSAPGLYSVILTVTDGRGGYAQSSLQLRTDELGVPFSGRVEGTDTTGIPGAVVEVNAQQTITAANGDFSFRVKDADRFVLNIRKHGYGLVSRIYDDGVGGGLWTMVRATVVSADPKSEINVADERDRRNCPGPLFERLNWRGFPKLTEPQWQDGKGNVVRQFAKLDVDIRSLLDPKQRDCGPGIRVLIPPNALVDGNGQAPSGLVDVSVATVDLRSPGQMPGDYTVADSSAMAKAMESYGAGTVEITAGGRKYNLRPGVEAELSIPVDPGQLIAGAPLPPQIPYLTYDEQRGVWVEEGVLDLQGTAYTGKVKHFSAHNSDIIKTNQACVRVKSPTLPPTSSLRCMSRDPTQRRSSDSSTSRTRLRTSTRFTTCQLTRSSP
jgi:hypothetical protein